MLQVRELAVEVGGSVILEGASFTIRARDKVGLVGRNGAGKTSLLKVLGGAEAPYAGVVNRRVASATCPRTRASTASTTPPPAVRHILSGRGFDEAMVRIEKLRIQMEEDPSERAVSRFTRAEEQFRLDGGYAAESEVRRIAAGLGLEEDRLDLPIGSLSGRPEAAGRDRPHPLRRQRPAPARRAHQPPRQRRQGVAARLHARVPRRAAGDQPRPRPARRGHHPRAAPRPLRRRQPRLHRGVQGHLLRVPRQPGQGRGPAGQGRPAPGQGDRPPPDARRPLRRQGHQGVDGPQHREADRPPRGQQGRGPAGVALGPRPLPAAAQARPDRAGGRGAGRPLRRPRGVPRRRLRARAGRAAPDHGPQRRRQDQPPAGAGRRATGRRGRRSGSATTSSPATTPRSTRASTPAARSSSTCASRSRRPPTPTCGRSSARWASPATRSTRTPAPSPAARRRSWRSGILVAGRHNLLLLDEPTNNLDPGLAPGGGRGAPGLARAASCWSATTPPSCATSTPTGCCSCPRAPLDHWADDYLELVELA